MFCLGLLEYNHERIRSDSRPYTNSSQHCKVWIFNYEHSLTYPTTNYLFTYKCTQGVMPVPLISLCLPNIIMILCTITAVIHSMGMPSWTVTNSGGRKTNNRPSRLALRNRFYSSCLMRLLFHSPEHLTNRKNGFRCDASDYVTVALRLILFESLREGYMLIGLSDHREGMRAIAF